MYDTFDPKKAWECQSTGVRSLSCLCADPSLRLPPAGSPAAACRSRPALSASEPAGSWREKKPSRETSQGECVRARVGACQRAREGVPNWKLKNTHARPGFTQTFNHSGRVAGHHKEPRKPPYRRGKLRSFFLRWWLLLCRGARCPVEDSLAGTGLWLPPQKHRLSGGGRGAIKN